MLVRFVRFSVVGALGIAVQIAALALLVSGLGVHYLPATAIAIELSVLHNFLWHERWTWGDRTGRNAACTTPDAGWKTQHAGTRVSLAVAGRSVERRRARVRLVAFHAATASSRCAGAWC